MTCSIAGIGLNTAARIPCAQKGFKTYFIVLDQDTIRLNIGG